MATYDERQSAALAATVSWLEDELREAKALIVKQQQAMDQLNAQVWELTNALHRTEDTLAAVPPRLEVLPEYEAQLRQLKDDISRVHEQGLASNTRLGELSRNQATDAERARAVLNELSHRMEAAERGIHNVLPRFDGLDEASRRSIEAMAHLRQQVDTIERAWAELDGRVTRMVAAGPRADQEFARLNSEVEALHRQDATVGERIQVYTEMLRRLETQIALVSSEVAVKQDVLERIELARLELHRLEERISVQEGVVEELRETDNDAVRQLSILEGRDKGLYDRLAGLQHDLAAYSSVVTEQFHRLHQSQERAKRRQIEEMEREIREMRTHGFRPVEDGA